MNQMLELYGKEKEAAAKAVTDFITAHQEVFDRFNELQRILEKAITQETKALCMDAGIPHSTEAIVRKLPLK